MLTKAYKTARLGTMPDPKARNLSVHFNGGVK